MIASVWLLNPEQMARFYFETPTDNARANLALRLLEEDQYRRAGPSRVLAERGQAAAEEMFDLTNNPCREQERCEVYGRHRSVSVGDIISVDGVYFLCQPSGWTVLLNVAETVAA